MLRVLRTDLYRLFRSKSFYVYPVVVTFVLIISVIFSFKTTDETQEAAKAEQAGLVVVSSEENDIDEETEGVRKTPIAEFEAGFNDGYRGEIGYTDQNGKYVYIGWEALTESFYDGFTIFFIGMILVIFATSETRKGFIKNSTGCIKDRSYMVMSKIIVGITIMVCYVLEYVALSSIFTVIRAVVNGSSIRWKSLPSGSGPKYFGFVLTCFVIFIAIITILELMHEITGSRALGIVIAFGLTSTLLEQLAHGVVELLRFLFDILRDFDIGKYLLMENIVEGYNSEHYHPEIALTMSLIYIVVGIILSIVIIRKKDIK